VGHGAHGPVMVIYPQGIWYSAFSKDDMEEITEQLILNENKIAKLILKEK
jgi:(2Fe-2S) ferredoxin